MLKLVSARIVADYKFRVCINVPNVTVGYLLTLTSIDLFIDFAIHLKIHYI